MRRAAPACCLPLTGMATTQACCSPLTPTTVVPRHCTINQEDRCSSSFLTAESTKDHSCMTIATDRNGPHSSFFPAPPAGPPLLRMTPSCDNLRDPNYNGNDSCSSSFLATEPEDRITVLHDPRQRHGQPLLLLVPRH
jgi:hypothetical protein